MSIRDEMLSLAGGGTAWLPDAPAAERFVLSQLAPGGGFASRGGRGDLYYTIFGMGCLMSLGAQLPRKPLEEYLRTFGDGESLDLVHLCCLARCWSNLRTWGEVKAGEPWTGFAARLWQRIEAYRSDDGGFNVIPQSASGSTYGAFVTLGAWQDLCGLCDVLEPVPPSRALESQQLTSSVAALHLHDGGYALDPNVPVSTVATTAAGVEINRQFGQAVPASAVDYLKSCLHPQGGFHPFRGALSPDLLSTAVALFALRTESAAAMRDPCRRFVQSLCAADGGLRGSVADDRPDVEYTFYGMMTLGLLAK